MLTDQTKLSKFESDHAGLEMVSIHQLVLYFLVYSQEILSLIGGLKLKQRKDGIVLS
jgi:hypothetical protein